MAALVTVVFAIIAVLQVPSLVQKKYWRELAAFGFLLSLGFALSMLSALRLDTPFIGTAITRIVKSLLKLP